MVYLYIIVMAVVTYLIRMIPLTVFRKKIENRFLLSFLYYVPYACLMAMTFPAIFHATGNLVSAIVAVVVAIGLALWGKSLIVVALASCLSVFIINLII